MCLKGWGGCFSCNIDVSVQEGALWFSPERRYGRGVCSDSGFQWGVVIALTRQTGAIEENEPHFYCDKITFKSGQIDHKTVEA